MLSNRVKRSAVVAVVVAFIAATPLAVSAQAAQFQGLSLAGAVGFRLAPPDDGTPPLDPSGSVRVGPEWLAGGLVQGDWRLKERGFGLAAGGGLTVPPGNAGGAAPADPGARATPSWRGDLFGWASYGKAISIVGNAGGAAGAALGWERGGVSLAGEAFLRAAIVNVAGELRVFARPESYGAPLVVPEAAGYAGGLFAALTDPGVGGRYGTGSVLALKYRASREISATTELAGFGPSPAGAGIFAAPTVGKFSASVQLTKFLPGTVSAGASATVSKSSGLQPGLMVGYKDVVGDTVAVSARLEWTLRAPEGEAWGGNLTAAMPLGETGVDLAGQFDLASKQGMIGFRGGF